MKSKDNRGKAGAVALKQSATNKVKQNKKQLVKALNYFQDAKIPLIKTELAKQSGLSIATLNRSPYKELIKDYLDNEKVLLSPSGRQELSNLIQENKKLRSQVEEWKEKYNRLKKEYTFVEELLK